MVSPHHQPPQQTGTSVVNQVRSTLVHVHKELEEKRRRRANVIVHGLEPQEGISDDVAFSNFMEGNLPVKPSFQRDKCRRLGTKVSGKTQPLLVVFNNTISAADVLACSSDLRRSAPNVFLNPDLTRAEAQLAYEERTKKRERRRKRDENQQNNESHSSNVAAGENRTMNVTHRTHADRAPVALSANAASSPALNVNAQPFVTPSI